MAPSRSELQRLRPGERGGICVVIAACLSSCSSSSSHADPVSAGAGGAGEAGASGAPVAMGAQVVEGGSAQSSEFAALYETVFRKYCFSCHGTGTAALDMSSVTAAYRSLVDVPANPGGPCANVGLKRVEPGDPSQSLLYRKLQTKAAPCGQQMPAGGELKPELQLAIEQWISAGAH